MWDHHRRSYPPVWPRPERAEDLCLNPNCPVRVHPPAPVVGCPYLLGGALRPLPPLPPRRTVSLTAQERRSLRYRNAILADPTHRQTTRAAGWALALPVLLAGLVVLLILL